ncbi:hypothetical protein JTE90_001431 [Oedothorax gibbosus]|uniref:Uncharacterized protein n=1 Tax=Oedothorax gibbosus TaxID=931172 RepID=A0AAV6V262_9ARAC|nr:hypothetical protein JTE90_001431 [Oedothorax gibbosus]
MVKQKLFPVLTTSTSRENMASSRSLSDSELNERSSEQSFPEQQRTKRYSGSQLTSFKIAKTANPYDANLSLADYQALAVSISSSEDNKESSERNDLEVLDNLQDENISSGKRQQKEENQKQHRGVEIFRMQKTSSFRNSIEEIDPGQHSRSSTSFKIPETLKDGLHQGINRPQSEETFEKSLDNSILYPILEVSNNKENFLVLSEDFIGEPRCLALKKYATDDDMDDVLELNLDEFDEDEEFINDQPSKPKSSPKSTQKKIVDDMFLDDDDVNEVKDSKKMEGTHSKINWDKPVTEKEEGELTPDLYSTALSDSGDSMNTRIRKQDTNDSDKNTRGKKPERKESNQDFFQKINRCFRQLEREFCNMHVPRGSRRMIGQLQNTLCNVDRMKRRLAFLIDSAKHISSDDKTKNSKDDRRSGSRRRSVDDGKSKSSSGRHEKSTSELFGDTIRSQKEAEARMNRHIRRTAANMAYAGTKEEKQRIQSLFKRQMNLITQHVIQKKDPGKRQSIKTDKSKTKILDGKSQEKTKAPELNTLDEMEAFLAALKIQKSQKNEIIAKDKQKGLLKFTTKKAQSISERRPQPVLLVGAYPPQVTSAQVDANEETEWEKQMDVLKALSDKRKEILKNKKDSEEVRLLQEQLRILTKMDNESSSVQLNSTSNEIEACKEKNVTAKESATEELKQILPNETESKKVEVTSLKGEITDSISVRKDPKEMECIKPSIQPRSKDCGAKASEMIPENSKDIKKRKVKGEGEESSSSETSKSDMKLKGPIPEKRKRTESDCELSSHKKYFKSERKSSKSRHHRSDSDKVSIIEDQFDEKLPEKLMSKKLLIVGDKNMALLNERFCLKVVGNQIYLKKVGKRTKRTEKSRREQKKSNQSKNIAKIDNETAGTSHSLEDMEEFLQQLRSKKKNVRSEEDDYVPKSNQPSRELKFMARIQAKRKAKLMACCSTTEISQKEARFLKDLEAKDPSDSPDTEKRKQKLMQKIKEETDAIVLKQKLADDDPLSDVKRFLNMIKEAESSNDEKSKQFCVSFSMKRSEVKQLENIASGKASAVTEESQKFLNSVRAKMRAKKAPVADLPEQKG